MSDLILYDAAGVPSPRRVRMCLIEKGLPFTVKWLNLALMDQKQPWYLRLNPTGVVPTLVHDQRVVYESNTINEYIDAVFPSPRLVPRDPWGQAQMRMWFAFEGDFAKPFRDVAYETMAKERLKGTGVTPEKLREEIGRRTSNPYYVRFATKVLTTPTDDELVEDRKLLLFEKMDQMEERLADKRRWLCGDEFTLADIALAPRIDMFNVIGVNDFYERYPRIAAFVAHVKARPSWEKSGFRPEAGETERRVEPARASA
jgi:glutathione S-transferase